jgi:hypothetical protein
MISCLIFPEILTLETFEKGFNNTDFLKTLFN